MSSRFITLYTFLALSLSAVLSVPMLALPAFAFPGVSIELGFLESIDDPSKLHIRPASEAAIQDQPIMLEKASGNDSVLGAWQHGLSPVWVWNPSQETTAPAVIASR